MSVCSNRDIRCEIVAGSPDVYALTNESGEHPFCSVHNVEQVFQLAGDGVSRVDNVQLR